MLVTLDLTTRQATRALAQAVQTRTKLEIEPRPEGCAILLWGTLASREGDLLQVDLHQVARDVSLSQLIGAMCDVRTILAGQLCLFSTVIVDASDAAVPHRLLLAVPETVQVANRRRYARKTPADPVPVRLRVAGQDQPFVLSLANIGPNGTACRARRAELDDALFIGDVVELEFALPWSSEIYRLPASVCGKMACADPEQMVVGLEFTCADHDPSAVGLEHLRAAINSEAARLIEMDGGA